MNSYEINYIRSHEFHGYEDAVNYHDAFKRVVKKRKSKLPVSSRIVKLANMNYVVETLTLKENEHKHKSKDNQCTKEVADKVLARVSEAFS